MNVGVLTAGGPAPGFNGVIEAVARTCDILGWTCTGIPYGYSTLIEGALDRTFQLTRHDVDGIGTTGGSILFTSRANPTKDPRDMEAVIDSVEQLGLTALVTIGGDDTATSAAAVAEATGIRVAHVPKTIDNDLPLPDDMPTFGFHTAAELGGLLCRNLRVDAQTTSRWYLVSAMGRSAGHLAMAMGDAADADLILLPEEFDDGTKLERVADIVERAIRRRSDEGQPWGLAVLGEGILDRLDKDDLATIAELEKDEHGNPRMSEIDLGRAVRDALRRRDVDTKFVTKLIGYELRCHDPVEFDVEYTARLGRGAVDFLADGEGNGIVTERRGRIEVLPFDGLRDPETGRIPVRRVDLGGDAWQASLTRQAR